MRQFVEEGQSRETCCRVVVRVDAPRGSIMAQHHPNTNPAITRVVPDIPESVIRFDGRRRATCRREDRVGSRRIT